jgi:DNA-binding NarL/FixJ family response regulator
MNHVAVRDAICKFIRRTYDAVCEADDGIAAIERAKECPPDLAIMDLSLPRLNGVQAASNLRRTLPGIKIIGFTSLGRETREALLAGTEFDVMLHKHDGLTNLAEAIKTLLPGG